MTSNEMNFNDPFCIEEVQQYLQAKIAEENILFSPKRARRLLHNGQRHYFYTEEREEKLWISPFYPSVTTVTQHGKNADIGLLKWYASRTWEETLNELWLTRTFGSFLHIVTAELSAKMLEFDDCRANVGVLELRNAFEAYAKALDLPHSWVERFWIKLVKAVISWRVFCFEYDVRFLLIEKTVFNTEEGYSGTLDYLLTFLDGPRASRASKNFRRYQLKNPEEAQRLTALLDVKSGTSGMQNSGVQQLGLLKRAAELNFSVKIDKLFHWNPTEWRTAPGFNLEDATEHPELQNIDSTLAIAKNRLGDISDEPYRKTVSNWLLGDSDFDYGFTIKSLSVREAVTKYMAGDTLEVGLPVDQELAAEHSLSEYMKQTITPAS